MAVRIRPYEKKDITEASIKCHEAFGKLQQQSLGRKLDFITKESTKPAFEYYFANPHIIGVVAEDANGKLVGTNFLDLSDEVASIGPISVSVDCQTKGVGSSLMNAVLDIAKEKNYSMVRLVQEAYNLVSFSLYTKLGFDSKDQLNVFEGHISPAYSGPIIIKKLEEKDVNECDELHKQVVGVSRLNAIRDALSSPTPPMIAVENGKIIGFSTGVTFNGIFITKNDDAIHALHTSFSKSFPHEWPMVKVIARLYPKLARKCLTEWGLKTQRNLTLMSMGEYQTNNK